MSQVDITICDINLCVILPAGIFLSPKH